MKSLIVKAEKGFSTLKVSETYTKIALGFLENWLTEDEYKGYGIDLVLNLSPDIKQRSLESDRFFPTSDFLLGKVSLGQKVSP